MRSIRASFSPNHFALLLTAGCVGLGVFLRLHPVGTALLFGDEFHSLRRLSDTYGMMLSSYEATGAGIALPLLIRLSTDLFGTSLWAIRASAFLPGVLAVFLCYPVARRMIGRAPAAGATMLLAGNSFHIFYSHFARAYALAILLVLLLLAAVARALDERQPPTRWTWPWIGILVGLLPWVHLATLGVTAPILLCLLGSLFVRGDRDRLRRGLLASAAGVALCILLYLPALPELVNFVERKTVQESYYGSFEVLDVVALLGGSWAGGWALLLGAIGGGLVMLRERHSAAWPLIACCLGPGLALLLLRPYGDAYAYSRYLAPAIPAWCILTANLAAAPWRARRHGAFLAETGPLLSAFALTAGLFLAGPLGLSRVDAGPYTNSYLSLFQLSKFSVARTPVPDFYRELADMRPDTAIVELPTLSNRSVHLYRGYYLLHGKRTMLSAVDSHGPYLPRDLYVPIRRQELLDAGVDFVVAHVDPLTEIDSYWAQVYGSPAKGFGRAYMERHERFGRRAIKPPSIIQLRKALGAPRYEDGTLIVWEIRSE